MEVGPGVGTGAFKRSRPGGPESDGPERFQATGREARPMTGSVAQYRWGTYMSGGIGPR